LKVKQIRLGVNIDHCATLRQVRGGTTPYPDILRCAHWAKKGGADLITVHLREDRRHIQDNDVALLCKWRQLPINLELAVDFDMVDIAKKTKPDWTCFVPEKRAELTTEGGLDVVAIETKLKKIIKDLHNMGIKVSLFVAPMREQIAASQRVGADAIELHTGNWVLYKGKAKSKEWESLVKSSILAHELGLGVHAGHGLDFKAAGYIKKLPFVQELNIGHSLICYSLESGLQAAVKKMKSVLRVK